MERDGFGEREGFRSDIKGSVCTGTFGRKAVGKARMDG
jgi:hypothetical protein